MSEDRQPDHYEDCATPIDVPALCDALDLPRPGPGESVFLSLCMECGGTTGAQLTTGYPHEPVVVSHGYHDECAERALGVE